MTVLWIVLGVLALAGAFIVIRALAKVAAAARDLQRNVVMLSMHVNSAIEHMGTDMQALNASFDELRRHENDALPEGAVAGPEGAVAGPEGAVARPERSEGS
jgi:outer membrane murein-binding lipoprotein Lpp